MPSISNSCSHVEARIEAIESLVHRPSRQVAYPRKPIIDAMMNSANVSASNASVPSSNANTPMKLSEFYGCNVYGLRELEHTLPKPVYGNLIKQMSGSHTLDKPTADAVAHAVKVWAMERGATHFTHWFQPLTDSTAEKHDSFLSLKYHSNGFGLSSTPLDSFSGTQLVQAEPDASSFPHGGVRTTFEARGYTVWDLSSPMFVQEGPHGTKILYIPSIFISYNGEALDEKTVLLRSCDAISKSTVELLKLLGDKETRKVHVTIGTEQEFFLVDRGLYSLRQDLKLTGRTLFGAVPAKHQQLEDHYFGHIPSRVLSAMSEAELELWKLGVPIKTRHNEVAPQQFEMAPIFEEASVAVDHNLLTMEILHKVAHRHGLKALFHEKPFQGINGSGKHCNWSLCTDSGTNLLEPTDKPETNHAFLLVLVSILVGLKKHSGLLRAAIASASNEHRLGANEAPPSIVSAFLGEHLNEVLNAIEEGREVKAITKTEKKAIKVGGTVLDVKIAHLPEISRDLTDRNRTSPFAFTGNKFEFRAVGSKQSPSFPIAMVNSATAASLNEVIALLRTKKGTKDVPSRDDVIAVLKQLIVETKAIRFEGDGYSDVWVKEAEKRGLPNIRTAPEAFKQLLAPEHKTMLTKSLDIMTEAELTSRFHVLCVKYAKDIMIESKTLRSLAVQHILPAAIKYRKDLAAACLASTHLNIPLESLPEKKLLDKLIALSEQLDKKIETLDHAIQAVDHHMGGHGCHGTSEIEKVASESAAKLVPLMADVRKIIDKIEEDLADEYYPLPKYTELLFF